MPPTDPDAIPAGRWAFGLGLAMALVMSGVALFTTWDYWHGGDLEQVETPTAVGDTHYGKMPGKKGGPLGLKYQGQPLFMISEGKVHDARLLRAGTDDSGYYGLYQLADPGQDTPAGHFYLKLSPDDYMEVATQ